MAVVLGSVYRFLCPFWDTLAKMSYFGDGPCPASSWPGSWLVDFQHVWHSMMEVWATGIGMET